MGGGTGTDIPTLASEVQESNLASPSPMPDDLPLIYLPWRAYHPRDGRSRQRLARLSGSLRLASAVRGAGFEPAFPRCSRRFFQLNQPPHLMVTSHRRTNPPRALQCPLCGGGTSALISGSHVPGNSPLQRCPDIEGTTGHDPATFWVEARRSTN